ncbi:hypothetical protein TNCV_838751 [Trichonephila clavipes]|nr:hypothetical protein TNCV_838751 [Trichonephila clavipes]
MPMQMTDVKLTRLRIGHTRFTHKRLLLGEIAPECHSCKVSYTLRQKYGKFTENCIPDGVFPIGDDVFVFASTYYDSVSVHIRRFKKYGKTYYPTSEGITLDPRWIEYIMRKNHSIKFFSSVTMHQDLAAFYENPEVPNSFGGVEVLHRSVKEKYSKKDVKHWLSQKDAYTLHKPVRHNHDLTFIW